MRKVDVQSCAQLLAIITVIAARPSARVAAVRIPRRRDRVHVDWNAPRLDGDTVWMETLSWEPRAFLYHNFLSLEECEHIIKLGRPNLEKSTVIDNETGKSIDSRIRTSRGSFLRRKHDEVVARIEDRIAFYTKIPAENGEALHVLHYEASQHYAPHFDYFHDAVNVLNGGQRLATMLMYLSDVEEGGETVFPSTVTKPARGVSL